MKSARSECIGSNQLSYWPQQILLLGEKKSQQERHNSTWLPKLSSLCSQCSSGLPLASSFLLSSPRSLPWFQSCSYKMMSLQNALFSLKTMICSSKMTVCGCDSTFPEAKRIRFCCDKINFTMTKLPSFFAKLQNANRDVRVFKLLFRKTKISFRSVHIRTLRRNQFAAVDLQLWMRPPIILAQLQKTLFFSLMEHTWGSSKVCRDWETPTFPP